MESLAGKVALITGGSKRIGKAISLALAKEGVHLIIHGSGLHGMDLSFLEEAKCPVKVWKIEADFTTPSEYETLIKRAHTIAGKLDILVNNASLFSKDTIDDLTLPKLMQRIEANSWVPFVLMRDFARSSRGSIVNILDSKIYGYDKEHASYILSKQLFSSVTRMAAMQFAPHVTVNGVAPGLILPPEGEDENYLQKLAQHLPLKRHGAAEDIAEAVIFLIKSDFVTGEILCVDGGGHLHEG